MTECLNIDGADMTQPEVNGAELTRRVITGMNYGISIPGTVCVETTQLFPYLLLETGDKLLLETGFGLYLEN